MDPQPDDVIEVDVSAVVAGGNGLARTEDGRVTFVTGGLPGERVRAVVEERKRDFARARVLEVVRAAPGRVEPPCPFVSAGCGGCDWQHVSPDLQRQLKAQVVADALRRQAKVDVPIGLGPDLVASGYRTTVRGLAEGGRFGFRRRASHDVVGVDPCLVVHPLLAELIADGRFPDGEVVLRAGARTGDRLVIVQGDGEGTSVPDDVRVAGDHALRHGHRSWYHEEVAGRRWRISARSFFQSRPDGADALVTEVAQALDGRPHGGPLVDLYGGVGLFAGSLPDVGHVTVVEQGLSSVADAKVNLSGRSARVVRADVARWGPTHVTGVVADPPRAGLGRVGVRAVVATQAERLALVSCDPASLGRDARLLAEAGYELRTATLVDLFPHTSHVEVVSRFDRVGPAEPMAEED